MDEKTFNEMLETFKKYFYPVKLDLATGKITVDEFFPAIEKKIPDLVKICREKAVDYAFDFSSSQFWDTVFGLDDGSEVFELARHHGKLHDVIYCLDYIDVADLTNKYKISISDVIQGYCFDGKVSRNVQELFEFFVRQKIIFNGEEKQIISESLDNPEFSRGFSWLLQWSDLDLDSSEYRREFGPIVRTFIEDNLSFILDCSEKIDTDNHSLKLDFILEAQDKDRILSQVPAEKLPLLFKHFNYDHKEELAKVIVDVDPNNVVYVPFVSNSYIINRAIDNGLELTESIVKKLDKRYFENTKFVNLAIDTDPNNILLFPPVANMVKYIEGKGFVLKDGVDILARLNYEYFDNAPMGKLAIDQDLNNIFKLPFYNDNSEAIKYAIKEKNFKLTKENIEKLGKKSFKDKELAKMAIDIDLDSIFNVSANIEILKYAMSKGLKLTSDVIEKLNVKEWFYNAEVAKFVIDLDPNNIFLIKSDIPEVLRYAIDKKGLKLTEENCRKFGKYLANDEELVKMAINFDFNNIFNVYVNGERLKYAMGKGLKLTKENVKKLGSESFKDKELAKMAIDFDPNNVIFISSSNPEVLKYAIAKGFKLTEENLEKFDRNCFRDKELAKKAIDINPNSIIFFIRNVDYEVLKYAINKGFVLTKENIEKLDKNDCLKNVETAKLVVDVNPNNIIFISFTDTNTDMLRYAIDKGFVLTKESFEKLDKGYFKDKELAKMAINLNLNNIFRIPFYDYDMLKYTIDKGLDLSFENVSKLDKNSSLLNREEFFMEAIKYDSDNLINYCGNNDIFKYASYYLQDKNVNKSSDDIDKLISDALAKSKEFLNEYEAPMSFYKGDKKNFFLNEDYFRYFLDSNGINKKDFIQYSFGDSYHWMDGMLKYNNYDDITSFKNFFDYYRKQDSGENGTISDLNKFMNCLKGYDKYKQFCDSLVSSNASLSEENLFEMNELFNYDSEIDEKLIPKNIDELTNFSRNIFDENIEKFFSSEDSNYKKNMFCRTALNADLGQVNKWLKTYGDTLYLNQLQFENKKDIYLSKYIEEMKQYTTFFEFVLNLENDGLDMDNIMNDIANDKDKRDLVFKWSRYLSNYEKRIKSMYAKETLRNLTDINNISDSCLESMLDKESTSKNGVNVYDFSGKDYGILAHVRSSREDYDELCTGKSDVNRSFISLSAISYINQRYYGVNPRDIVLGYSQLSEPNFIRSSPSNMGSNASIRKYDSNVSDMYSEQRGFLDTSSAPGGYNSEFLCYREGLKPDCIILPGGREPNSKEIEIAKKYGLYFVKTQENNKYIDKTPEKIEYKDDYLKDEYDMSAPDISEFKKILGVKEAKRKICIFTDPHALFEPTAAILEDARKNGATEFYSLGDNIGTGPNPEDVLDLFERYDVKSVKGNHEMYVIDGVDAFKEHLSGSQMEEARMDSDWTRDRLSTEQLEKIKEYPDRYVIEIAGEKMLLCHHLRDYNTGERLYNPDDYDRVFQGHEHFENRDEKSEIYTVRGAGIGYTADSEDTGKAKYIEITEDENGKCSVCVKEVPFYLKNAKRDVIVENGPSKEKMGKWLGG